MKAYFSHDEGARNDPKLVEVMMQLGHEGKSVYWDLVEMLYEQGGYLILSQCKGYAFALRTSCELILSLVNDFDLFASDGAKFWSETALERMKMRASKSEKRAAAGAKGGKAKAERLAMLEQSQSNAIALPKQNLAIKEKEIKGNTSDDVAPPAGHENQQLEANPARRQAVAVGDGLDEQPWHESPLAKPAGFQAICEGNGFLGIDFEYYRLQALDAAKHELPARPRTAPQWRSWVRKFLDFRGKDGPLRKLEAGMPTAPTPKDQLPEPGKEKKGQIIAIQGVPNDESLNRMKVATYQQHYPTAIIHAIR